jgi:hypothetical protein
MSMTPVDVWVDLDEDDLIPVDVWVPDPAAVGPPIEPGGQPLWNDGQWNEGTW